MKGEEIETFKKSVRKIVKKLYKLGNSKSDIDGVLFYRIYETEKFLNWAILNNFLLHGSTRRITENLKPYQANDKAKESGNRRAIYITKVPAVAMFCALTGGVDGLSRRHSSHTKIEKNCIDYEEMYFGVNHLDMVTETGYIYILGKNQVDEEINGEFLAYKEICPLAIIEIWRKDFPFKIDYFKEGV
jgi:hypothetical protein